MLAIALLPKPSLAQSSNGIFTVTGDLRKMTRFGASQNEATSLELGIMPELGLQLRLMPSWFFKLSAGKSSSQPLSYAGGGFRIAMPGFFLLGVESSAELGKKRRLRLLETALHTEVLRINDSTEADIPLSYFSTRGLFVADLLLSRDSGIFLKMDFGMQAMKGNLYVTYGLGLGLEF